MKRQNVLRTILILAAPLHFGMRTAVGQVQSSPPLAAVASAPIVIAPDIFDELGKLADTLRLETVRCLLGAIRGDSVIIDVAWKPQIDASTANGVHYRQCPVATIALWHNHRSSKGVLAEYSCYLSEIDIEAALRPASPPLQIVQVKSGVRCWWSQAQIAPHSEQPILLPLAAQRDGKPARLTASRCRNMIRKVAACALLLPCADAPVDRQIENGTRLPYLEPVLRAQTLSSSGLARSMTLERRSWGRPEGWAPADDHGSRRDCRTQRN